MKGRVAIAVALALAAPPLAYLLAAAVLGFVAVNGDFRPAPQGVTIARDGDGRPRPIEGAAYADHDRFYEAVPSWQFWFTCNEWTRRALAAAGVRTAFWAPFPWPLFWQLERAAGRSYEFGGT